MSLHRAKLSNFKGEKKQSASDLLEMEEGLVIVRRAIQDLMAQPEPERSERLSQLNEQMGQMLERLAPLGSLRSRDRLSEAHKIMKILEEASKSRS